MTADAARFLKACATRSAVARGTANDYLVDAIRMFPVHAYRQTEAILTGAKSEFGYPRLARPEPVAAITGFERKASNSPKQL